MTTLPESLAALPDTSDAIANMLTADGNCRGTRNHSCDCPLARYLTRKLGRKCIVLTVAARFSAPGSRHAKLPHAAEIFVDRFDQGAFPELDETKA